MSEHQGAGLQDANSVWLLTSAEKLSVSYPHFFVCKAGLTVHLMAWVSVTCDSE